jgi:DHA3 family macrolide efflux protein-like MFS transporter
VLIAGIALGLILGLLVGGRLTNLAEVRLRFVPLIAAAVVLRFGTEALLAADIPIVDTLRLPLLATAFAMLLVGLWANRAYPGMTLAFVGTLANALVIVVNLGYMPIWEPALTLAGLGPSDVDSSIHMIVSANLDASFLLHLGPLGDVIPIPFPLIQNVASVGDLFLAGGLTFFLFASVVGIFPEPEEATAGGGRRAPAGNTGLTPALAGVAALERPLFLGGRGMRLSSPTVTSIPAPRPEVVEILRRHPYVRLALNGSFSALWAGQFISMFGDRIHQFALAAVVLTTTGSEVLAAFAFVAAALPNLFLSPIAGTFVDRWDRKEVLVVSDILRAAVVLLIPIAAVVNVFLVYPLIFIVTSISIFFRPARVAILPQLVERDELVTANSAMWVGETIADVVAYPLAGLFVASLMSALPLAFWLDAVTYLASAVLLATIVVRPRTTSEEADADEPRNFMNELKQGWRFLRNETVLLANTIQAAIAQFTVGILTVLTVIYCYEVYRDASIGYSGVWGFLEAATGAGNLIGGFVIGLIGSRIAKGRMIIAGYAVLGLSTFLLAITDNVPIAVGLAFGSGVANMVFLIPSQALFQERTPSKLLGRVVSFRFALVFGSMTVAMAVGSLMIIVVPATFVIALFGLITLVTGLAGLFVPAIRNA